jgi:aspartate ammonia-lyase
MAACDEILGGSLRVVCRGCVTGRTSHNMNANEVIANRAIELSAARRRLCDHSPNDHVNMAQSTNDVCPTAIALAQLFSPDRFLLSNMETAFSEAGSSMQSSNQAAPPAGRFR